MSSEIERYQKHIENWVDSLDSEISYWNYAMREMGGEFFVYWENLVKPNKPFVYENFLKSLGDSKNDYKFIDVGSGPCFAGGTVTKDI
ncbi:MAG: hypothetical protein IKN43_14170, partial [Selenomonadaceae bacterium]|nr:hypothetical protein [Selenomonadaceae bacterium]